MLALIRHSTILALNCIVCETCVRAKKGKQMQKRREFGGENITIWETLPNISYIYIQYILYKYNSNKFQYICK